MKRRIVDETAGGRGEKEGGRISDRGRKRGETDKY